jgi:CRISPR-associated protein Cmr1
MRGYKSQYDNIMKALISIISQLGGLGAKTQYGFGVFCYENSLSPEESLSIIKKHIVQPNPKKKLSGKFPSLSNYWLLIIDISEDDINKEFGSIKVIGDYKTFKKHKSQLLPVSFDIRYKLPGSDNKGLRHVYRQQNGTSATRSIFGTLKGNEKDKRASSIFVSHFYKMNTSESDWQFRVWGFTKTELANEIEIILKDIFPRLKVTRKVLGIDLLNGKEVNS